MVAPRLTLAAALAFIVIAIIAARPQSTPGPIARDFEAYWAAGATWNARADPYGRAIWNAERQVPGVDARRDELLPFIGPPATLLLWTLFARLPFVLAVPIWLALLMLAAFALVVCTAIGSHTRLTGGTFAAVALLAVAFGPLTSDLALGQVALFAVAGAAIVAVCSERLPIAAWLASLAAFAQPNLALGLISQLGRNRTTLVITAGAIVTYVAGAFAASWTWPLRYGRAVLAHAAAEHFAAIQVTPAAIAYGFGASPLGARVAAAFVALLACLAAIALTRAVAERFARFAAFSALVPFVAGFLHEHDLVVAFVAAAWCGLRTRGTTRALALAGTLLVAVDWLGLAQRPTGIVQSALLSSAALCTYIALGERDEIGLTLGIAAAFALLFCSASLMAIDHPLPVWPDGLGALHLPGGVSAAGVWAAEQRAVGLDRIEPAWSLLRSLSLLGCALLAAAIYRHFPYHQTGSMRPDSIR